MIGVSISLRLAVAGLVLSGLAVGAACAALPQQPAALPSWNDGETKAAILDFVGRVSQQGSPDFVPPAERIAVFDNDGTLWAEQPAYVQAMFALDRVRALAKDHPEWQAKPAFAAAIDGDLADVAATGEKGLMQLVMASHAGMTSEEFSEVVRAWLRAWRHPTTGRACTEMVYQPMLELLEHLRGEGFKVFIVSGGGIDFLRVFAEETYGIPPEQVIGSSIRTRFEMTESGPVIRRLAEVDFIDDQAGKPVAIDRFIGRRPIAAFGNSDGDLQMLQWTAAGPGARFMLLVHHTDAEREWAYDRKSSIGRLDLALDEARERGWTLADMQRDWKVVFPER